MKICKKCGRPNDGATSVIDNDHKMKVGDISFCFYCNTISRLSADNELIPITAEDLVQLFTDDEEAYWAVIKMRETVIKIQHRINELKAFNESFLKNIKPKNDEQQPCPRPHGTNEDIT